MAQGQNSFVAMGDVQMYDNEQEEPDFAREPPHTSCWPWSRLPPYRVIWARHKQSFPSNRMEHTKYNILTFIPLVLFNQFKYFFNLFFLVVALTQFYPPLQVGFQFTYIAPLVFVLVVTMIKEASDDISRYRRDSEANSQLYTRLDPHGNQPIKAEDIKVGDLLEIVANQRVPADLVLLHTSDPQGSVFIRTDQLDGETDWKLRNPVRVTQALSPPHIAEMGIKLQIEQPQARIYDFSGQVYFPDQRRLVGLKLENTLWAETVLAAGTAVGLVIYTGKDTRSSQNSSPPTDKIGITDLELNALSKYLCVLMVVSSAVMLAGAGLSENSPIILFRYVLLLSSIIPISLRVNLDMAKMYYAFLINHDPNLPGTQARSSVIPEELGRVQLLLTDKTGTLTQNDMVLKVLSLNFASFDRESTESQSELTKLLTQDLMASAVPGSVAAGPRRPPRQLVRDAVAALALCHNVTPVTDEKGEVVFQASSPDEIALVKFAVETGYSLYSRTQREITLTAANHQEQFTILHNFAFSSATKRMGLVLRDQQGRILVYFKGAEDTMTKFVSPDRSGWVLEKCQDLATQGLRTLVIGQLLLTSEQYESWRVRYERAELLLEGRELIEQQLQDEFLRDIELLAVTGVEDKLQDNVADTVNRIRTAGIPVWMITGDKVETAKCIATSTQLYPKGFVWRELVNLLPINSSPEREMAAIAEMKSFLEKLLRETRFVLVVDGSSLRLALSHHPRLFVEASLRATSVVCCRVSPTQKAAIVDTIKAYSNHRICSIGDGGNDVGMIQAAHVGIGIPGKEGNQAALASDFSIVGFGALGALLLWHGRLSYKRTAKLSGFVFHRGLILAVIQALFICLFYFVAIPIYNGLLMMGYTTVFTMLPVFAIVLDEDSAVHTVLKFPELYKNLQKGRLLGFTSFLVWIWQSVYQGAVIMLLVIYLFPDNSFTNIVAITFSALILTELLNILTETEKFHWAMMLAELVSLVMYVCSIFAMQQYFDIEYIVSLTFLWRVVVITLASWGPLHVIRKLIECVFPSDVHIVSAQDS